MRGVRLPRLRPASAGRHALPVALAAFAVVAAASTAASGAPGAGAPPAAARTTLPPVAPPTYSYSELPGLPDGSSAATGTTVGGVPAPGGSPAGDAAPALASNGIPQRALSAYQGAAAESGCGLPWTLVAAIGRVESNHGRFAGATLLADGRSDPPIVGIPLDGRPGVATITDTDGGRYDGDRVHDRAVGPMQFIPGTWALFAADGDGDGKSDPYDLDDAAAAAAEYLCRAGGDLSTAAGQQDAVYSYNRSDSYVRLVLDLSAEYARGTAVDGRPAPQGTPRPLPPVTRPTLPPVTVGTPPAVTPTRPAPTRPAPTTSRPAPTTTTPTTRPTSPSPTTSAPTTTSPAPTTSPPSATPSCTPSPTPTPTPTGSITPESTPTPESPATQSPTAESSPTATTTPTGSPTPTPTPCTTP